MNARKRLWMGAAVLLALQLSYMLLWWNKGIQLNSNGLPNLAALNILAGQMPYRDFHFWCPPGCLLIYTALTAMFGDGLIYVRAWAVVERMAIFLLMYFWLARVFSARAAFFGSLVAGVGFSSDVADAMEHYGFESMLASVAAGYAACLATTSNWRWSRLFYLVTGLCAGLCMVFKQTQGAGLFPVLLVLIAVGGHWRGTVEYLVGWTIPTGLTAIWLVQGGAWRAFVSQTFLQGTSSKGSLGSILLRPLTVPLTNRSMGAALALAILLIAVYAFLARQERESAAENGREWVIWTACALALAVGCGAGLFIPRIDSQFSLQRALAEYSLACIFIGLFGCAALALRLAWKAFNGGLDNRTLQIWILASVSAAAAYMFSLSWAAFEQMLVPAFAFLMAMALDNPMCRKWKSCGFAVIGFGLVLVSGAAVRKLAWPYYWENWVDGPVKEETVAVNLPELRGIRVTARSAEFLERVTRTIDAHSQPSDKILCFPNYALFYVLAHREPGVFAYMHWFDIVSDGLVREEENRIREHPPAVILSVEMPESMMHRMETQFRNGAPSGQREMLTLIHSLPGYRLIESIEIPYQDYPLNIYVRN